MAENKKNESELRCGCGSLIARVIKEGVEIKCRRCKKIQVIPLNSTGEVAVKF